ncbi:hypothetical protein DIS18_01655 [Algibacter marinivivus]|uniref:Secretion system C-terminal sorting domain-containing protein n=1 Tax=Algibacter marinivivus TaxID=2100723 RepID=A0A2U2X6A3_9FLAO|nr:T9SS type A sorting domain-containing protein [Algibacter marinivivus]PWH83284.1 hypothetical protein DIS18_01655 [Algibacter marinivivus]
MNQKLQFTILFILLNGFINAQTTYYVDQTNGNDSSNGTSAITAYKTFDKAESKVNPGDTIEIIGVYKNTSYNENYSYSGNEHDAHLWHSENTIRISGLDGAPNNYITIKAHNSNTVLKGDGSNIVRVLNSSYLKFEGLEIFGEVNNIPLSTANALQFVYIIDDVNLNGTATAPTELDIKFRNEDETNDNDDIVEETDIYTNINNLEVLRPSYVDTRGFYITNSNNIIIKDNKIHHTPGGGLRVSKCEFVDVLENEIYRCSAKSYSGTHALVITNSKPITGNGYSINVLRNEIHHNYNELYSWSPAKTKITPRIDEGKGISLQKNNTTEWINGSGRILVANNVCYWNGFSGVHTNDGNRIDFINNTCYLNSYTNTITYAGEDQKGQNIGISAQSSNDISMINNISVIDTDWGGFALSAGNTTNLVVNKNIIYGINGTIAQDNDITSVDSNTIIVNPMFISPGNQSANSYNFGLQYTSQAIGAALTASAPSDDFYGKTRDSSPDLGAIEYDSTLSINTKNLNNLAVYPNPFKDNIMIRQNDLDPNEVALYNLLGQNQSFNYDIQNNVITLKLNHLAIGFYILKIGTTSKKIVKTN